MCETQNGRLISATKISSIRQTKALAMANRLVPKCPGSIRNSTKKPAAKNVTWLTWLGSLQWQIAPAPVKICPKCYPSFYQVIIYLVSWIDLFWLGLGWFGDVTLPIKSIKCCFLLPGFSMCFFHFPEILIPIDSPKRELSIDTSSLFLWLKKVDHSGFRTFNWAFWVLFSAGTTLIKHMNLTMSPT